MLGESAARGIVGYRWLARPAEAIETAAAARRPPSGQLVPTGN